MHTLIGCTRLTAVWMALTLIPIQNAIADGFASYPPLRTLPQLSTRALGQGPAFFVNPQGDDTQDGTQARPWRTLARAVQQLRPGDTLYLRGGIYWEHVSLSPQGAAEAPITIRSYPGEMAIIDAGYREFFEAPDQCWERCEDGGEGEYRSKKTYAGNHVGGNFGDSLVPLRMYGSLIDLRAMKEHEDKANPTGEGVYVGPGIKRDAVTGHLHVRLGHTSLLGLGDENYGGETDPRKLPLIIAGDRTALTLRGAQHVRLHDLVIRGATTAMEIANGEGVELEGITIYAVRYGLQISATTRFKARHCAFRGFDAPWHPRASGTDVDCFCPLDLVTISSGGDLEFAYNEFTDHHDAVQIGDVESLSFHHNLVERINDDGVDFSFTVPGVHRIFANRISRCLTPFSIHDGAVANDSRGVYVYRNVIDLRRGTYSHPPTTAGDRNDAERESNFNRSGRLAGDHGSPTWPGIYFYHNTVLETQPSFRNYYGSGLGYLGLKQTKRRVFNNLFVHHRLDDARKGALVAPNPTTVDLEIDGNLFWGLSDGAVVGDSYLARFRRSPQLAASKDRYAPGWTSVDMVADPGFQRLDEDLTRPTNLTLIANSPAVASGVVLSSAWPDLFPRNGDFRPDRGAVPHDGEPGKVGVNERFSLFP